MDEQKDLQDETKETTPTEEQTPVEEAATSTEEVQTDATEATEETADKPTPRRALREKHAMRWYVVHTYSGHENKVKINLDKRLRFFNMAEKVEEIFIPTQEKIEVREGKRREVTEHLFPGYILVKMDLNDALLSVVKDTPGVTGFVGTQQVATPLADREVEAIRNFTLQDNPQYEAQFSVGEGVKIIDGPFNDFIGTVDRIDEEKGVVTVLINIFGRETPVELDFLQIGKL